MDCLLKNAMILDAGHSYEKLDIMITNGIIQKISKSVKPSEAVETVDLSGYTIIPGLFDAHVHLAPSRVAEDLIFNKEKLKQWAKSGILGIRDMGLHMKDLDNLADFQREIDTADYPQIVSYGPFMHTPGSVHGPFGPVLEDAETALTMTKESLSHDIPGVKFMLNMKSDIRCEPIISAVANYARTRKKLTAAHIMLASDIDILLRCGVNEAAHMPIEPLSDVQLSKMVDAGLTIVPTVANYYRMYRDNMLTKEQYDSVLYNIGKCWNAGVNIGFGTDFMLVEDRPYIGYMVPTEEMRIMAASGMPVQAIITAATLNSARLCGLDDTMGTIEQGKAASLIAVRGRVDDSFSALESVPFVMNRGKIINNQLLVEQNI